MKWKSLCLLTLKSITEIVKKFKSLYDFGGRCLKIRDVCMDFELYFKVHNLVSVHPKSIILGQMTNLNMIFHVVVSVYQLVEIWNSPQFPDEFRNGQFHICLTPQAQNAVPKIIALLTYQTHQYLNTLFNQQFLSIGGFGMLTN